MKTGYLLETMRGERYFITDGDAHIARLDMPFDPTPQWRAVAIYTSRGSRLSDWETFASQASKPAVNGVKHPMRFKNGSAMYHLGDFDHGTYRSWGVGIYSIRRANFAKQSTGFWSEVR